MYQSSQMGPGYRLPGASFTPEMFFWSFLELLSSIARTMAPLYCSNGSLTWLSNLMRAKGVEREMCQHRGLSHRQSYSPTSNGQESGNGEHVSQSIVLIHSLPRLSVQPSYGLIIAHYHPVLSSSGVVNAAPQPGMSIRINPFNGGPSMFKDFLICF